MKVNTLAVYDSDAHKSDAYQMLLNAKEKLAALNAKNLLLLRQEHLVTQGLNTLNFIKFKLTIADIQKLTHEKIQKGILRPPAEVNGFAFHITDFKTPKIAYQTLQKFVDQFCDCIKILKNFANDDYWQIFFNKIDDSKIGCLEARFQPAIYFVVALKDNKGLLDIHDLFHQFWNHLEKNKIDKTNEYLVNESACLFFIREVRNQTYIHANGTTQLLTFNLIEAYLKNELCYEHIDFSECYLNKILGEQYKEIPKPIRIYLDDRFAYFYFNDRQRTQDYRQYIANTLPTCMSQRILTYSEIQDEYHFGAESFYFTITLKQYQEFVRITYPYRTFSDKNFLIKSVRNDERSYIIDFILALLNRKHYNLRAKRTKKNHYVVHSEGVVNKHHKMPDEAKNDHMKPTSTSLVGRNFETRVFRDHIDRNSILAGFIFFKGIPTLIKRYDTGTVDGQIHDNNRDKLDTHYQNEINNKNLFKNFSDMEAYFSENTNALLYNEILFRPYYHRDEIEEGRLRIGVFCDNLPSRILAIFYAYLLNSLSLQEKKLKSHIPSNFNAPSSWEESIKNNPVKIQFYIPGCERHLLFYEIKEQLNDISKLKSKIDKEQLLPYLISSDFFCEALLILNPDTHQINNIPSPFFAKETLLFSLIHAKHVNVAEILFLHDSNQEATKKSLLQQFKNYKNARNENKAISLIKNCVIMGASNLAQVLMEPKYALSMAKDYEFIEVIFSKGQIWFLKYFFTITYKMQSLIEIEHLPLETIIKKAITYNQIDVFNWLAQNQNLKLDVFPEALRIAALTGREKICEWLLTYCRQKSPKTFPKLINHTLNSFDDREAIFYRRTLHVLLKNTGNSHTISEHQLKAIIKNGYDDYLHELCNKNFIVEFPRYCLSDISPNFSNKLPIQFALLFLAMPLSNLTHYSTNIDKLLKISHDGITIFDCIFAAAKPEANADDIFMNYFQIPFLKGLLKNLLAYQENQNEYFLSKIFSLAMKYKTDLRLLEIICDQKEFNLPAQTLVLIKNLKSYKNVAEISIFIKEIKSAEHKEILVQGLLQNFLEDYEFQKNSNRHYFKFSGSNKISEYVFAIQFCQLLKQFISKNVSEDELGALEILKSKTLNNLGAKLEEELNALTDLVLSKSISKPAFCTATLLDNSAGFFL